MPSAPPLSPALSPSAARARLAAVVVVLGASVGGCSGCHRDHPYTPYRLDDAGGAPLASARPGVADAGASPVASAFAPTAATPVADGHSFALGPDRTIVAPKGRVFTLALVLDADGDGMPDLLAWAYSLEGDQGGLYFASGAEKDAPAIELVPGPAPAPSPGLCKLGATLAAIGPRTIALDVTRACGPEPGRWLTLVRPAEPGPKRARPVVALEVAAKPTDAPLDLAVEAADRDGDGRDDPSIVVGLGGAPPPFPAAPGVKAAVRFLDRPSGLARDPSEPEASLAALAQKLVDDARRKSIAKEVPAAAAQLRRLRAALCAEDGEAAVTFSAAGRLACGPAKSLEDAAFAEGSAALTLGDPLRAAGALARLEALLPGDKATGRRRELEKLVAKGLSSATAKEVFRTTQAPAAGAPGAPSWLPLSFEASGDLLVRTASGVVRVRATPTFAEEPAPEVTPWPTELAAPRKGDAADAPHLAAVAQRCGAPWLTAQLEATSSKMEQPLPIATPVAPTGLAAAACAPVAGLPVVPLDASPLRFVVGSELVELTATDRGTVATLGALDWAPARTVGSARSPDGRTAAVPLPSGVLVVSDLGKPKPTTTRVSGPDVAKAWSCTPANGGKRLACVTGSGAAIYDLK
jgi:hypothetical protein